MERTQIYKNGKLTADFKAKEPKTETKKPKKAKNESKEQ
jgi:hypothetical protein